MERAHVFDAVAARWTDGEGLSEEPRPATREELLRVHTAEHVDAIARTSGRAVMLDPDTFTSPESAEIAVLAAGAAVQAVDHAIDRKDAAFALVRPPAIIADRPRPWGSVPSKKAPVPRPPPWARAPGGAAKSDSACPQGT